MFPFHHGRPPFPFPPRDRHPFHTTPPNLFGHQRPSFSSLPQGGLGPQPRFGTFRRPSLFDLDALEEDLFGSHSRDPFAHETPRGYDHEHHSDHSPFNSQRNQESGRSQPFELNHGERYIFPPEQLHLHIPVIVYAPEDRSRPPFCLRSSRESGRSFVAVIPIWATIADIYRNLGRDRERNFEVFVVGRYGEALPLDILTDLRDLEKGVEMMVLVER